jgi:DNA-binding winged helix-turn-helix (wHTH) protein
VPDHFSSVTDSLRLGSRAVIGGIAAVVAILAVAAGLLFAALPDANAFNARVEQIFVQNNNLTSQAEIKLLEVLAQSGTAFSDVLSSYRVIIFILLIFAAALLLTTLIFLLLLIGLNRRMIEIRRAGIEVQSLRILRNENAVMVNDMAFSLTPAAIETLSILAEARMDDDILTGVQIEAMISGRDAADCEEAAGATRIKRLRDALGNQLVTELLVRNIARKGYALSVAKEAIRVD